MLVVLQIMLSIVVHWPLTTSFMNHAPSTLHDYFIGPFNDYILLWWIWRTCLLLDSTFTQKCIKFFGHKLLSIVGFQDLDLHVGFVFHQHLVFFEFVKHFSLGFQQINMCYFQKIIIECDKVLCSTMKCCLHWPTHIGMNNFQKLWSRHRFIFGEICPLLFAINGSFTHMVQWHFLRIHAFDHFIQLL